MTRCTFIKNLLLLVCIHAGAASMAQVKYYAKDDLQIVISGTSTMHDWDMKTSKGESNATVTLNDAGQLSGLTALSFTVPAESLKSDHKSMDKNAYKALKTRDHTTISYTISSASIKPGGAILCQGKLSIAGTTLDSDLTATGLVNADKSISVKGSKKISMSAFNMTPPSFMLGTVKTGNDVTVHFNLTLRK
ncbi:MAG: YceI family protein [Bacteroidota bacterium]